MCLWIFCVQKRLHHGRECWVSSVNTTCTLGLSCEIVLSFLSFCFVASSSSFVYPKQFSSCSLQQLSTFMEEVNPACLLDTPSTERIYGGAVCGNAFLETGEECDCGTVEVGARNTKKKKKECICNKPTKTINLMSCFIGMQESLLQRHHLQAECGSSVCRRRVLPQLPSKYYSRCLLLTVRKARLILKM